MNQILQTENKKNKGPVEIGKIINIVKSGASVIQANNIIYPSGEVS